MGTRVEASRLAVGVWCRFRLGQFEPGGYRKVDGLQRFVSNGRPMLRIRFANGTETETPADASWEIDMEIDQ